MKLVASTLFLAFLCTCAFGQTNMRFTNSLMQDVLSGNYNPADYPPVATYDSPEALVRMLQLAISEDSLKSYLLDMQQFENRNTAADTLSEVRGMGAARKWVLSKFDGYSDEADGRLLTGYFQFDQDVCGVGRHKNVVALLPGADPEALPIIIEGHMDSRCSSVCDVDCEAQGMEDNASGTALVMELARTMAPYSFNNTILFMATTGEEQGLVGANAVAQYFVDNDWDIKMVQNNDIVGGIICGETSSAPSCPGLDHIDSTQVRMFSRGSFNAPGKGLARFIKLQYAEMLEPLEPVPMLLTIMSAEDRTGRGGDHIPFRERGFAAMRFTSANEHGNASNDAEYHDRQHTSEDILGVDTNGDGALDSFYVNFNYLARNARINATSSAMAAIGPRTPSILEFQFDGNEFAIRIESEEDYPEYVIGFAQFRTISIRCTTSPGSIRHSSRHQNPNSPYFSLLPQLIRMEWRASSPRRFYRCAQGLMILELLRKNRFALLANRPNPFDEATTLSFWAENPVQYSDAYIAITDQSGTTVAKLQTEVQQGMNEVLYRHGYGASGLLVQTLVIDGKIIDSGTMIFAN